jgi:hypothetical protein
MMSGKKLSVNGNEIRVRHIMEFGGIRFGIFHVHSVYMAKHHLQYTHKA